MLKQLKNLITTFSFIAFAGASLLANPAFVYAATGSVHVGQPSTTGVDPVPGSTGGGTVFDFSPPVVKDVKVLVSSNSATVNWETNELATYQVTWGTTRDYRSGSAVKNKFDTNHSALISDLLPNTTYYFQITTSDTSNNQSSYKGMFVTLTPPDTVAPSNVEQFTAQPQTNRIQLSWNNPSDTDFDFVRIIRSEKFFPIDPLNGQVLYEGKNSNLYDTNVVVGKIYYYAAFARDVTGNYSSGSVSYAMIPTGDGINFDPNAPTVDLQLPFVANPPEYPNVFKDFSFSYREGFTLDIATPLIPVGQSLEIAIPKERLPDGGTFLTLTVTDIDKKTSASTYLFSYDSANQNFKVKTPVFKTPKSYALVVTVFNSTKLIIEKVSGEVQVVNKAQASAGDGESSKELPGGIILVTVGIAAVLVTIHFWRLVRIRKKLENSNTKNSKELK